MRIALVSDIHGNCFSFEAVLGDIEEQDVDEIICLGDVVAFGPEPGKCLERLKQLECIVVVGNTDDWVLQPPSLSGAKGKARVNAERLHWCCEQLSSAQISYIRSFQPTVEKKLDGETSLLCFHGSPKSFNDIIKSSTPKSELEEMFNGSQATVLAGGHTHVQMMRRWNESILINPGSVGLPVSALPSEKGARLLNHAEYAILTADGHSQSIQFRHVKLDIEKMLAGYVDSDLPYIDQWISGWRFS